MKSPARMQRGFTLLELSIVLALIGIILGGGLVVLTGSIQASQYNKTVARMDAIEKALLDYSAAFNRIPCPANLALPPTDTNYGVEAAVKGTCTGGTPAASFAAASGTVEGGVPTRALQLPDSYMYDTWGNRFRYAVDPIYTAAAALPIIAGGPCAASTSAITVNDSTGAARTTAGIYAIISHGANGHGAYTSNGVIVNAGSTNTDEQTNCHCNSSAVSTTYAPTYVEKAPTQSSTSALNSFDDIVTFKEGWQMQAQNFPLAAGKCTYIYVADSGNNRVQVFTTSGQYLRQFGSSQLSNPYLLAVDSSGNVFVGSWSNDQLVKFDSNGNYVTEWGGWGNFGYPGGVAIDSSGNVWFGDFEGNKVDELDNNLNPLQQFADTASATGGIAIAPNGNIWVADVNGHEAIEFTTSGTKVTQTGPYWNNFYGIATDSTGNIWGTDEYGGRILEYSVSGTPLTILGGSGSANGQLYVPIDVKIDPSGNVWVADELNNRVQEFTSSGTWIRSIGGPSPYTCETSPAGSPPACAAGSGNGQFNAPDGIAIVSR